MSYCRPASRSGLRPHAKRSAYQPESVVIVVPWLDARERTAQQLGRVSQH